MFSASRYFCCFDSSLLYFKQLALPCQPLLMMEVRLILAYSCIQESRIQELHW